MKVVVKDYSVRDRHFVIVNKETESGSMYLAIEDKYIDADGKLNTALNGLQMHASKDLNMCLNTTKDAVEVDYLVSTGMTRKQALDTYWETIYESMPELD